MPLLQHILYVDDEPDMRLLVQLTLENTMPVRVTAHDSAVAALAAALADTPQLILLDAMMPGMDGPAILQEIKRDTRLANIPVIFLTAKAAPSEQQRLSGLGALGVITKPFALDGLAKQVQDLWQKFLTQSHVALLQE